MPKNKVMHLGHNNTRHHQYQMNRANPVSDPGERHWCYSVWKSRTNGTVRQGKRKLRKLSWAKVPGFPLLRPACLHQLEFSIQAWSSWTEANRQCLERIQRMAIGMVSGLSQQDYEGTLNEMGLVTQKEQSQGDK